MLLLCILKGGREDTELKLLHFITEPFSKEIKNEIQQALSIEASNVKPLCSLNFKLGLCFANAVKTVCQKTNFPIEQLVFWGWHGQTVFHHPIQEGMVGFCALYQKYTLNLREVVKRI